MTRLAFAIVPGGILCAGLFFGHLHAGEQPASISPGTVQDTLRQQPPESPLPLDTAPPLRADVSPESTAPIGPAIPVTAFIFTGNDTFSDEVLAAQLEPWTNTELTLDAIYTAADALTLYYREQGYGLAQVTVPAQKINDGIVELRIIEGRIGSI
ncbi:MAG: hypothetical protein KY410_04190, partial [Proteobacteria bacterium]|nr:hypothetical protein [Pseudomonadota bacterium]